MNDLDFFTPGARLALELECLLMDTRDAAVQSRWWDSAHEALEQWRQAVRAMEAAIAATQGAEAEDAEEAARAEMRRRHAAWQSKWKAHRDAAAAWI